MKRWMLKAGAVTLMVAGVAQTARADDPTVADLKSLLAQGQYQQAILGANQLLDVGGSSADSVDRQQILRIKGEAQLQVHAYSAAADTFSAAAKTQADNPKTPAVDAATAELIRHSSEGAYTPKAGATAAGVASTPIDILSKSGRTSAFGALFDDELAADKSQFQSAESEQNLPTLLRAVKTAKLLDDLEIAATGKDEQTHEETDALFSKGYDLINSGLQKLDERISSIASNATANEQQGRGRRGLRGGGYRSMNSTAMQSSPTQAQSALGSYNISQLNDIIAQTKQFSQASDAFGKLAEDSSKWTSLSSQAERVATHAQDVLNGNFTAQANSGSGASQ